MCTVGNDLQQANDEFVEFVYNKDWRKRDIAAKYGRPQDLDILVYDIDDRVRMSVLKHGRPQDLDVLVKDVKAFIRYEVLQYGRDKDLDILVNDVNDVIRIEVAKIGRDKDLDILVSDKNDGVRLAVAKKGRPQDLLVLAKDKKLFIRRVVAEQNGEINLHSKDNEKLEIRALTESDKADIEALESDSYFEVSEYLMEKGYIAWGAFLGDELIGYCSIEYACDCCCADKYDIVADSYYSEKALYLDNVFVSPYYRGNGYGKKLVRETIEKRWEIDNERNVVYLVSIDDKIVENMYESLGFEYTDDSVRVMRLIPT